MKFFVDKLDETTKRRRMPILVLCALIITYCILYASLIIGEYALFVGGAIVGGLWSEVWKDIFQKGSPLKKLYSLNYLPYIAIFIALCFVFYILITRYPLI